MNVVSSRQQVRVPFSGLSRQTHDKSLFPKCKWEKRKFPQPTVLRHDIFHQSPNKQENNALIDVPMSSNKDPKRNRSGLCNAAPSIVQRIFPPLYNVILILPSAMWDSALSGARLSKYIQIRAMLRSKTRRGAFILPIRGMVSFKKLVCASGHTMAIRQIVEDTVTTVKLSSKC